MTHEQWIALTPEQQRIKVAELCGRRKCGYRETKGFIDEDGVWNPQGNEVFSTTGRGIMTDDLGRIVPDYLNDLNAMHEAETTIPVQMRETYYNNLICVVYNGDYTEGIRGSRVCSATAAQRAEAFVMTMEA
jgi:hypothetical protein